MEKRASYLKSLIPIRIYHIKINRSVRHLDEFELFTVDYYWLLLTLFIHNGDAAILVAIM